MRQDLTDVSSESNSRVEEHRNLIELRLEEYLKNPDGILLIKTPCGSGKSTISQKVLKKLDIRNSITLVPNHRNAKQIIQDNWSVEKEKPIHLKGKAYACLRIEEDEVKDLREETNGGIPQWFCEDWADYDDDPDNDDLINRDEFNLASIGQPLSPMDDNYDNDSMKDGHDYNSVGTHSWYFSNTIPSWHIYDANSLGLSGGCASGYPALDLSTVSANILNDDSNEVRIRRYTTSKTESSCYTTFKTFSDLPIPENNEQYISQVRVDVSTYVAKDSYIYVKSIRMAIYWENLGWGSQITLQSGFLNGEYENTIYDYSHSDSIKEIRMYVYGRKSIGTASRWFELRIDELDIYYTYSPPTPSN